MSIATGRPVALVPSATMENRRWRLPRQRHALQFVYLAEAARLRLGGWATVSSHGSGWPGLLMSRSWLQSRPASASRHRHARAPTLSHRRSRGEDRLEHARRHGPAQRIVDEGEEQILADVAHDDLRGRTASPCASGSVNALRRSTSPHRRHYGISLRPFHYQTTARCHRRCRGVALCARPND